MGKEEADYRYEKIAFWLYKSKVPQSANQTGNFSVTCPYIGIADGMSIARVWGVPVLKMPASPRRSF